MMNRSLRALCPLFLLSSLALGACASDGGQDALAGEPKGDVGSAATAAHPARMILTGAVLTRLQARAAANDASWVALKAHCDSLTQGTVSLPTGNAYPNFPNVGQGYQGDGYLPEVMSLGLCYQSVVGSDPTSAAAYGAAGDRILAAMSAAVGSGGQSPSTDSGYGMRNYGVGMAFGFDWLYSGLSAGTRAQVVTALNNWVTWYDASGFSRNAPVGNYFAGYLLAKTAAAIATEGDNPAASTMWSSVQGTMYPQLIQGVFNPSMKGGGFPEGWEYGPRAVENMALFFWAVKTGKGVDWSADMPFARDEATYLTHFTWPSLKHIDDQGTIHSGVTLSPPGQTAAAMAAILGYNGDAAAPVAKGFASTLLATNKDSIEPWQAFLYVDDAQPSASYTSQPLSYYAPGPNHVAARSSWATDAVWGSFVPGTYINSTDSGEQSYNSGAIAIVAGDKPIICNPTGQLPIVAGTPGEDLVYSDSYGSSAQRKLFNTFGATGVKQAAIGPSQAKTQAVNYEDNGTYVHARGVKLEQMYSPSGAVSQWTRDFAYVRPGVFVVLDRTTSSASDNWISWHTQTAPQTAQTADGTQKRFDVTGGSVRVLLPKSAPVTTVPLAGGINRLEVHSPSSSSDFLTVVTAGATPEQVRLSNADGNVKAGSFVGALVQGPRNAVVLFGSDHAASQTNNVAQYTVAQTAAADHVLFDMAPSANGYAVTASSANGALTINVQQGGSFTTSAAGTLAFTVNTDGSVSPAPVATQTPPAAAPSSGTSAPAPTTTAPATTGTTGTTTAPAAPSSTSTSTSTAPAPAPSGGELLTNGSFESGTTGWTKKGAATLSTSTKAQSGSGSAQVATSTWGDGLLQQVTASTAIAAGTPISASAYVAIASGASTSPIVQLSVNYADGTPSDIINKVVPAASAGAFSQALISFTPAHPVSSMTLSVVNNSGSAQTLIVDSASLTAGSSTTTTTSTGSSAPAPSAGNLLSGTSFSGFSGTAPAGWTKVGAGALKAASSGAVEIDSTTWGDGIAQTVTFPTPMAAGTQLSATATAQRLSGDAGVPVLQMVVNYSDGTSASYVNVVFGSWTSGASNASNNFTAAHPVSSVAFRVVSNAGSAQAFALSQPSLTVKLALASPSAMLALVRFVLPPSSLARPSRVAAGLGGAVFLCSHVSVRRSAPTALLPMELATWHLDWSNALLIVRG